MKKLILGITLLASMSSFAATNCDPEEVRESEMRENFIMLGIQGKLDLDEVNTLTNAAYGAKKVQELNQNACEVYASELDSIEKVARTLID